MQRQTQRHVGAAIGCESAFFLLRVEHRSPAIFTGGGHEFVSEIGLFRQLAGNDEDFGKNNENNDSEDNNDNGINVFHPQELNSLPQG